MTNATACPRCGGVIGRGYYEPSCLTCGYADYSYVLESQGNRKKNLLSQGTRYVLRYVGTSPALVDTLCHIKQVASGVNKRLIRPAVNCPFCRKGMKGQALSGMRRDPSEQRYKCAQGHRVSLTIHPDGSLGWK